MRCTAYLVPSDAYRDLETQLLQQLAEDGPTRLDHLLEETDLEVVLLSGEWRALFAETGDFFQVRDDERRIARMAVSPDEMPEFVALLRDPTRRQAWEPIAFGLSELIDALPSHADIAGLVIIEENDDWTWAELVSEIQAIRPEVYTLLRPHVQRLIALGDHQALARLCGDHAEAAVEFTPDRWAVFREQVASAAPELLGVIDNVIAEPADYTSVREAIGLVADPAYQPSLDAWLRVCADAAQYALYFRDAGREREG